MNSLPDSALLGAIRYRISESEGLIVFGEDGGFWGHRRRFSFQRKRNCWYVSIQGTHDTVMVSHLLQAYKLVCDAYGGDFKGRDGEHRP